MGYLRWVFLAATTAVLVVVLLDINFLRKIDDLANAQLPNNWRQLVREYDGNFLHLEAEFIKKNEMRITEAGGEVGEGNIGSGLVFTDDGGIDLEVEYGFDYYFLDLRTGCWRFMHDKLYLALLVPRTKGLNWIPYVCP